MVSIHKFDFEFTEIKAHCRKYAFQNKTSLVSSIRNEDESVKLGK